MGQSRTLPAAGSALRRYLRLIGAARTRSMPNTTYRDAIRKALADEMRRDQNVILFGEDVAIAGGVFKVTPGLCDEFVPNRVRATRIAHTAIVGAGLGAAVGGLQPGVELMFVGIEL